MRGPALCVLLAVLLISPWPILALNYKRAIDPHLVAVPARGDSPLSAVSAIFSRGRFFQIVNLETSEVRALVNPYRKAKHAAGLRSAFLLLRQNVGVVIARHIGPEPFNSLSDRGVRIFTGQPTTVQEAIDLYRRGRLQRIDRPDVQIHYGLEHNGIAVPKTGPCPLAAPQPAQHLVSFQQVLVRQRIQQDLAVAPERRRASLFFPELGIEVMGMYPRGVEVSRVEPGSPADRGGVTRGAIIIKLDGRRVLDLQTFAAPMVMRQPRTVVTLGIVHDGRIENRLITTGAVTP